MLLKESITPFSGTETIKLYQTIAETPVLGRHRVEHGPVAVDADQEIMPFRDGFELCAGIVHGKRNRFCVRKGSGKRKLFSKNIKSQSRKIKPPDGKKPERRWREPENDGKMRKNRLKSNGN